MNNKIKIAFVIPTLSSGGMERVMSEIVTYSSMKPAVECHLVVYGKPNIDFYKISAQVQIHKPNFIFNDAQRNKDTLKTMYFIRKTVKQIKPDSILSFGEYWNNLVLISLLRLKIPIFVSDRSSPEKSLGKIHGFLRSLLYPTAAGVIVQTTKAKKIFKTKYNNSNVKVIGNPIRNIGYHERLNRENIIVTVGRLINSKNFDHLIDIFSKLNNPDWKLVIIGGDSNKENNSISLQAHIDRLGLNDNVILTGVQKNVEDYLLRSKIFAFTSSSEGFPNVIGEAMSAGLPVVSYDCVAGPSDMIKDGENGFLIPLFDDQKFVEKLQYLTENEDVRAIMGSRANESIKSFSVQFIGEKFFDFITRS